MSTYAIGDVQGCHDELRQLLERLRFNRDRDRLWFVGDLVNRGPKSLEVLRFVRDLGDRAVVVLGNHDLHLICLYEGFAKKRADDTFDALLDAPDARELIDWLRTQSMMHVESGYAMVHAGLLPQWSVGQARMLACEVEQALRAPTYRDFLGRMYGSSPDRWNDALQGWDRLRVIVNALTRMRFCTPEGVMDFRAKGSTAPQGFRPWFELRPDAERESIVCGHWSALGLRLEARLAALDSGCVWGGSLAALCLEDRRIEELPCRAYQAVNGES